MLGLQAQRPNASRRRMCAAAALGVMASLAGCGGSAPESSDWVVAEDRALTLAPGTAFDLSLTLPTDVRGGGVFDVDPAGAPLPSGVTLSKSGILNVGASAAGSASGVMFRYTPPA